MRTLTDLLLVKIESAYNTDPTPVVGTDGVLVATPNISMVGARMNERPATRASLGKLKSVQAGFLRQFTCETWLKGSGTAGTPPETDPLLRACGFAVTNVPATSDTYKPSSAITHESCTIYYWQGGVKLYKITGCRGNVSFTHEAGGLIKASFTMTGHCVQPTDDVAGAVSYDTTVPAAIVSGAFAIGGYSAIINAMNFDMGNKVSMPPDVNSVDTYGEVTIVDRAPNGSIDPQEVLISVNDFEADYRAGTSMAITFGPIGGTAGNIVNIDMPAVYYADQSMGDRDGLRILELPFNMTESSGDDEVSIAFT